MWYVSFFVFSTITLLCLWLTLILAESLSFGGHQRAWHAGGGRPHLAIEALKKEVETLEAENTRLVGEVGGLRTVLAELEEF